ncbi:unnamed protein product [Alopecurus aequalis]
MAKGAVMLLLFFMALAAVSSEAQHGHRGLARGHRRAADPDAPTHLHFFFHDTVSGKSPSAVRLADPVDPSSQTFFGMVNVMDDPLTEGPEPGSAAVGRAQGLYMATDQAQLGFLQAMNLVLTSGPYNGSTLAVLGRNCPLSHVREMPVIGGTGAFRFARGYAQARTHWLDFKTGDATVEYDVYVMH